MRMPKENVDTVMFAPCGMNCLVCYKHCCHKKPCAGCLNSDIGKPEHCRKCKIKDCVRGKGISYCFECPDYPCKLIKNLEKSYNKRYLGKIANLSVNMVQQGLWKIRRKNIPARNVAVSFPCTTENVANARKFEVSKGKADWHRQCKNA